MLVLKLSSSSVSGKTSSSLCLDFFRPSENSRLFFFSLGDVGKTLSGNVASAPGLNGPGLPCNVLALSPSLKDPERFRSLFSLSGDFSLNKLLTLSVLDLFMMSGEKTSLPPKLKA